MSHVKMTILSHSADHAEIETEDGLRITIRAQQEGNEAPRTRARVTLRTSEIAEFVTGVSIDADYVHARQRSAERKAMLARIIEARPVFELLLGAGVGAASWTRSTREGEELTMEADRVLMFHGRPADVWLRKLATAPALV